MLSTTELSARCHALAAEITDLIAHAREIEEVIGWPESGFYPAAIGLRATYMDLMFARFPRLSRQLSLMQTELHYGPLCAA